MARKISQQDPALAIEFFLSGFYTHRSQLFAPFKGVGVNVISFHDPVIDGHNMEDTDLYEWTRRAGYSIFCPIALPDGEVVNQYYSSRNLNGTVLPWVDTTRRIALFSSTSLTTVLNKTTTAQGYVTTIGNMTYLSDGASADLMKFDGTNLSVWGLAAPTTIPTSTGLGFWQPDTHFSLGNSIQDTNGNVESVSAILVPNGAIESPTAFYNLALAGSTGSGWTGTIGPGGTVSNTVSVTPGYTDYVFFGNCNLGVPSGATILGVVISIPKEILGGTAVDESVKLVIGGAVAGVEHASATPWNTLSLTSTTYGTPTDNWGGLTPSQANTNGAGGFGFAIAADVLSTTNFNLIQSNTANNIEASTTLCAFNNPVQAGNTLVVCYAGFNQSFVSIHDTLGTTYTLAATSINGEMTLLCFVGHVASGGPNTVTASVNNLHFNSFTALNIHEFSGIVSVSPIEVTGTHNSLPAPNQSPFNTGTVTTANATDLLFSMVQGGTGITQPAAYTYATQNVVNDTPGSFITTIGTAFAAPGVTGTFSPEWSEGSTGLTVALKSAQTATAVIGAGSPNLPIVTIYYKLPSGVGPGYSGNTEPIWPVNLGTSVNDGGLAWTNYGAAAVWYPLTNYPTPIVILDTNGFLQLATAVANPVQPWASGTTYAVGNVVTFGGNFWISTVNSNTGIAPNANYSVAVTSGSTVTTTAYWALANNPVQTGSIAPVWNTTIGGTTVDGSYTWTNIGQGSQLAVTGYAYVYAFRTIYGHLTTASPYSNNTGAILGPLNGSISGYSITSDVVTFFGSNNFIPGNVFTVQGLTTGVYLNEQVFTVISATDSQIFPLTSVAVSADVLTIQAINNLVAGQQVTFSSVGTATFLNGVTVTVLSGGLSGTQFEANFTHTNYGPTADTGDVLLNGSWTATFTHADTGGLVADAGQALPLISTVTGTGTGSPLCNSVANITGLSVTDNLVTLIASNNFQPGIWVTIAGLTTATYLNDQQFQVISVDQLVGTQNTQFQIFFETANSVFTADSGTATFNAVEIYRTSDGGGQYLFDGAVTNPGAFLPWTFDDFVPDADLDVDLEAALDDQNDPPPGGPGSTITTTVGTISAYWNGRIWLVVGNYVYFDAGPDCTNGIPEESWPPGNRFQFAGPVIGLEPMQSGAGLIVYLADRVNVILGGPETISFYPDDFLTNFGIANPNAVFKDGSMLGQFTTQAYYTELSGRERQEIGEHIADYLSENFTPAKTYVTMHRNGLDVGVFVSNGVDQIVRYGTNIGAWSVPAYPIFGAGALNSVETSVGIYSLMTASPTGGVTGATAALNPGSGVSVTGTGIAWLNPGNITAGSPTSYATVTFAGAAAASQILRAAAYALSTLPSTAVVQGIQVAITGKQSEILGDLSFTIAPTNAVAGATTHTGSFGTSNTTVVFGSATDTWNMPAWMIPTNLVNGALSFDITAKYTAASTPEMFISEVQVTITYQNPGNYLYARDINSWGDCGGFGLNNGTPYTDCDIVLGSITLTQPGARLMSLQHIVGYFDAVGNLGTQDNGGSSYPEVWVMPNEISDTKGIGFIQLPDVTQEPPVGQNIPSQSLLALRWPVNMMNSTLASQLMHHLQVRILFNPENAPNTIKALAFMESQET
jgi:hypothetical protein